MSEEREFGKFQGELEFTGVISNTYERNLFINALKIIYDMVVEFDTEYYSDDDDVDPDDLFVNYTPLTVKVLEDISNGNKVDGAMVSNEIEFMIDMLNSADLNDVFGSEGWHHRLGWN